MKDGHKVKLTVKFKGREMAHPEVGREVLNQALLLLGEKIAIDKEPKFEGRKLSMIVGKNKGGNKALEDKEEKNEQTETKDK